MLFSFLLQMGPARLGCRQFLHPHLLPSGSPPCCPSSWGLHTPVCRAAPRGRLSRVGPQPSRERGKGGACVSTGPLHSPEAGHLPARLSSREADPVQHRWGNRGLGTGTACTMSPALESRLVEKKAWERSGRPSAGAADQCPGSWRGAGWETGLWVWGRTLPPCPRLWFLGWDMGSLSLPCLLR